MASPLSWLFTFCKNKFLYGGSSNNYVYRPLSRRLCRYIDLAWIITFQALRFRRCVGNLRICRICERKLCTNSSNNTIFLRTNGTNKHDFRKRKTQFILYVIRAFVQEIIVSSTCRYRFIRAIRAGDNRAIDLSISCLSCLSCVK